MSASALPPTHPLAESASSSSPGTVADRDLVLGIDVGGTKTAIALATTSGAIVDSTRITTTVDGRADDLFSRIADAAAEMRSGHPGRVVGIAMACPGIAGEAGVALNTNIPGWDTLAVRATLERAFPEVPCVVLNDARAATIAELRTGGLVGVTTGIYVNIGTGLSCGIVVDGRVLSGHDDAAGEIAYQMTSLGGPAFADGHAPLEEAFSGLALVTALGARAVAGDGERVRGWITENSAHLSLTLANLSIALNPQRIVVGGGLAARAPYLLDQIGAQLRRRVPFPPEIMPSTMPHDAALVGAVLSAIPTRQAVSAFEIPTRTTLT